jgi:hypothetical protein
MLLPANTKSNTAQIAPALFDADQYLTRIGVNRIGDEKPLRHRFQEATQGDG